MKKAAALLGLTALLLVGPQAHAKNDGATISKVASMTAQETFDVVEQASQAPAKAPAKFDASVVLSNGKELRVVKVPKSGTTLGKIFAKENLKVASWRTEAGAEPKIKSVVANGAALFFFEVKNKSTVERIALPSPVVDKLSDSLPKGKTTTLTRGKDGLAIRTITVLNNVAKDKAANSEAVGGADEVTTEAYAVVKAPTATTRLVGTSEKFSDTVRSTGELTEKTLKPFSLRPIPGKETSSFGMRVHPITGVYKLHDGLDLSGRCSDSVKVVQEGLVVNAKYSGGYGNQIVIDHGNGVLTSYSHLSTMDVKVGDAVAKSNVIGKVGSTGYSTGCHLHFMVKLNGVPLNPKYYLPVVKK